MAELDLKYAGYLARADEGAHRANRDVFYLLMSCATTHILQNLMRDGVEWLIQEADTDVLSEETILDVLGEKQRDSVYAAVNKAVEDAEVTVYWAIVHQLDAIGLSLHQHTYLRVRRGGTDD